MHCDTQHCCPTSTSDAFACRELWRGHQQEHSSIFGTGTWTKPPPDFKTKGMKVTAGAQRNYKSGISSRLCSACQKADLICSKFHLSWYPGECGMTHRTAPSLNWKKVFPYSLKYTRCSLKRRKSDRKPAQWLRWLFSSQRTSLVTQWLPARRCHKSLLWTPHTSAKPRTPLVLAAGVSAPLLQGGLAAEHATEQLGQVSHVLLPPVTWPVICGWRQEVSHLCVFQAFCPLHVQSSE